MPGSGLKKGQKVITADLKHEILVKGKPLDLLCNVSRGLKIRVGPQAGPGARFVYPTLRERLDAARTLLAKVLPDMKATELSGPDGDPIELARAQSLRENPRELARRVALLLSNGDPEWAAASQAEREARANGNGQDFEHALAAPQEPAGESGGPDTPDSNDTTPASTEGVDESAELTPPPEGKSLWFGLLEVRNVGPCRKGLPDMFALHRGGQEVMRSNLVACLAKAEKLLDGVPLPEGKLADTRTEAVPLHVRADQSPPLPQHSYATRRRAR